MALLVGCSGAALPTGTFRGERSLPIRPGTDPVIAAQMRRVVLTVNADGTATLEDGGLPYDLFVARHGDRLDLEVRAIANRGASRTPARTSFEILSDGSLRKEDLVLRPAAP